MAANKKIKANFRLSGKFCLSEIKTRRFFLLKMRCQKNSEKKLKSTKKNFIKFFRQKQPCYSNYRSQQFTLHLQVFGIEQMRRSVQSGAFVRHLSETPKNSLFVQRLIALHS